MRQINFAVLFALCLLTVFFTLENTTSTTVNIIPGSSASLPLAALLLISAGLGAFAAWLFAEWTGIIRSSHTRELMDIKKRLEEMELDLNRYKTKQKILPFMKFRSSSIQDELSA